jgi:hypothetical protein
MKPVLIVANYITRQPTELNRLGLGDWCYFSVSHLTCIPEDEGVNDDREKRGGKEGSIKGLPREN